MPSEMKKWTLTAIAAFAGLTPALADFSVNWSSGFANGGIVPDSNTTGWSDSRTVSIGAFNSITDVNLRLTLSGGWNGDLYAYLVHDSGFTVLLNRVGVTASSAFGYGDAGMSVTFNDQASQTVDFHLYRTAAGYNASQIQGLTDWKPDGRNISPLSSGATFDSTSPTALLSSFNGINPNGSWTLFLSDLSLGGQTTVTSWGLTIDGVLAAVPEPRSLVEGSLAALVLAGGIFIYRRKGQTSAP